MPVQNQKDAVPFAHYLEKFRALDARETALRMNIPFENGEFAVRLLGTTYYLSHPDYALRAQPGSFAAQSLPAQTFLLRSLVIGREAAPTWNFLTFRELPWGEVYVRPFSGRVLARAAASYGARPELLRAASERLGATPLPHGDVAYEYPFLGNLRLRLILWRGDEELPASAQMLFSDNFTAPYSADDRAVAGELLLNALRLAGR